jgi:hypothetical protein
VVADGAAAERVLVGVCEKTVLDRIVAGPAGTQWLGRTPSDVLGRPPQAALSSGSWTAT